VTAALGGNEVARVVSSAVESVEEYVLDVSFLKAFI